ncbi:MAG TPA: hypothetical protein VGR22_09025 [Thermomicrobiales bacterium]|nr:hypothetical protein [Thermomicrobiales bacterium]
MQLERTASAIVRKSVYRLLMLVAVVLHGAVPAASQAQDPTPAAIPTTTTVQDMFALVPAQLPGRDDVANATIAYADIEAHLDAVGATPPDSMDSPGFEGWAAATRFMTLPSPAQMLLQSFREDYGFDLLQVDQTLWVALPPFELAL